jgi:hypothetical protein
MAEAKRLRVEANGPGPNDNAALATLLDRLEALLTTGKGSAGLDDVRDELERIKSATDAYYHDQTAWATVSSAQAKLQVRLLSLPPPPRSTCRLLCGDAERWFGVANRKQE